MKLDDLLAKLKGKKTYLAAAGLVVVALVKYQAGDVVGAGESVAAALGLFGLRTAQADTHAAVTGQPPPGTRVVGDPAQAASNDANPPVG